MRAPVRSIELSGLTNLAVLAPIKPGFVDGFETITYLERLKKLLDALHASRQNQRESELRGTVFPDSIGRWGIIRSFRYAIVSPRQAGARAGETGSWLLSLNVSFDGGWEPYMRVIYRDIGPLLDALFCHCEKYPGSRTSDFDTYCRWVRSNEIDGGIFYADSAVTAADQRYLSAVERAQRELRDPADPNRLRSLQEIDKAIAGIALEPEKLQADKSVEVAAANPLVTLALPLRTLKGLYRLSTYFPITDTKPNGQPDPEGGDGGVLVRFAHSVLREFRRVIARQDIQQLPAWKAVAGALHDELSWFATSYADPPMQTHLDFDKSKADLQASILADEFPATHGCMVLLAVQNPAKAMAFIGRLAADCKKADKDGIRPHIAFTFNGLAALGIAADRLDRLPQEFAEGMEARSGVLGDLRDNHPDHWLRPLRDEAHPELGRIDLATVHVVVQFRLHDLSNPSAALHPLLAAEVKKLRDDPNDDKSSGMAVLAVQATYREGASSAGHLGFADGLSQPKFIAPGAQKTSRDDQLAGELLLGYPNERGDVSFPASTADELLDNGTFLVVRKLRQRMDWLYQAIGTPPQSDAVMAKIIGRQRNGDTLVKQAGKPDGNDFDYSQDPQGKACPFHSHIRRTNPRDGRQGLPRILRRGMSYGPSIKADPQAERGVLFGAYCASIAEQFETVQRWVSGANSSGVGSAQSDPMLGVPQPGERRTFRYVDEQGDVARVDLGDKPLVQLEWGLYLFVPSCTALGKLADFQKPLSAAVEQPKGAAFDAPQTLEGWRELLEDKQRSPAAWEQVRYHGGQLQATGYGTLLGSASKVLGAFQDEQARDFSVAGYGQRMDASVGLNHLGMDPATGHSRLSPAINKAIEAVDEKEAFETALPIVQAVIAGFIKLLKQPDPSGPARVPIDLVTLSEKVLAALCAKWVGLPDAAGQLMTVGGRLNGNPPGAPRCPGHLLTPSRFVFTPHPRPDAKRDGPLQGDAVRTAVDKLLAKARSQLASEPSVLGKVAKQIDDDLQAQKEPDSVIVDAIAGVLLGFPPTVHGNFLQTLETWIDSKALWTWQQRLADTPASDGQFGRARSALFQGVIDTMRHRPVPEMLWRCPVVKGEPVLDDDQHQVLGIASALTDPAAPYMLMFGGSRADAKGNRRPDWGLHACPGYEMGVGVMLALIAGLLDAGTLRPTGSPVLLMLTPRA